MEIDDLINKYLDGDLTPEEDAQLQELLQQDRTAAEQFHSMLLLYSTLKNDAETIELPKHFEKKFEERLLASYFGMRSPNELPRFRSQKQISSWFTLILCFLFFVQNIQDGKLYTHFSIFISEITKQKDLLWNDVQNFDSEPSTLKASQPGLLKSSNTETQSRNVAKTAEFNSNIFLTKESFKIIKAQNSNPPQINIQTELPQSPYTFHFDNFVENGFKNFSPLSLSSLQLSNLTKNSLSKNFLNDNFIRENPLSSRVNFGTFSSTEWVSIGEENSNIKSFANFTQSIGYSVSEKFRFGFEFGYAQMSFVQKAEILVPLTSFEAPKLKITDKREKKDYSNNLALATESESDNKEYVSIPIEVNLNQKLICGAVFLEYIIPVIYNIRTVGHVSVGGMDNGYFGAIKIFEEVELINGLSLIIGTEGRTIWMRIPISSKVGLWSTLGILYGLSYKVAF